MRPIFRHLAFVRVMLLVGVVFQAGSAFAWETDQYTKRLQPINDSTPAMDKKMNQAIELIVEKWRAKDGVDPALFAYRLNKRLVNALTTGRYEHWLNESRYIDRLSVADENIFTDSDVWTQLGNWLFGPSDTIVVNGVRLGTDKPGHFLAEGYSYYWLSVVKNRGEDAAIRWGVRTEQTYYGYWMSGVYGNADLVANYEGYRFYRSLFEDGVIEGKPSILKWENGFPVIQRPFTWADHVTEFWDESINPSLLYPKLQRAVYSKLLTYCSIYKKSPEAFISLPDRFEELRRRYAHVGMIENFANRLDLICGR